MFYWPLSEWLIPFFFFIELFSFFMGKAQWALDCLKMPLTSGLSCSQKTFVLCFRVVGHFVIDRKSPKSLGFMKDVIDQWF